MQEVKHSQNFLINGPIVQELVKNANFNSDDTILDIGAGKGIITLELIKYSENVLAIEIDPNLISELNEFKNVSVINEDFLKYSLPSKPFKTFSNIPFNRTAEILKKLLNSNNFVEGYIVVQSDASLKYGGEQLESLNSMLSIIYGVEYTFEIAYKFSNSDFSPIPQFNIVLLHIKRRDECLIRTDYISEFKDFVAYIFNKTKINIGSLNELFSDNQFNRFKKDIGLEKTSKPSEIEIEQYVYLFNFLINIFKDRLSLTKGYFFKLNNAQENIEKIHRSRNDRGWKRK